MNKKNLIIALVVIVVVLVGLWQWSRQDAPSYPEVNSPRPFLGLADSKVVVEEFSDFQCPACKAAQPIVKDLIETLGGRIKFSYRHFPLLTIHTQAFRAALASECANDQGKFWEYHDILFEKQPAFSPEDLKAYAGQLGLKTDDFAACLDSRAKNKVVREEMKEGDKRNVNGTPTFFLNGEKVEDWSKLKELIQAKLVGG